MWSSGRASAGLLMLILCLVARECLSENNVPSQPPCATTCHEVQCTEVSLRYGKYCGVGHGGCPGEKPCDAVDACCKRHDSCVEEHSVASMACHKKFLKCLDKQVTKGGEGFSTKCPYSTVIPTMKAGIETVMAFGSLFGGGEL